MNTRLNYKISIIIPIYNEIFGIETLLDNLNKFKNHSEIIFVDGGSSDGSDKIISDRYRLVYSQKKGRSYQMNYGASLASGDVLLFLHGDSYLYENALVEINNTMDKGYKVGCFKIKFKSKNWFMKICGYMSNLRVRWRNIAFGDQGIFISKDYFYELGRFKEIPLMEDYQLSMDIKNNKEKIKQCKAIIETSERRFLESGRLKTMARMQRLQYMYRRGEPIDRIASLYK